MDTPKTIDANTSSPEKLQAFFSDTTLHGIRYIARKDYPAARRSFWLVVLLTFLGIFINDFVTALRLYYSYESSISVQYKTLDEVLFPSVTICNVNFARKSVSEAYYSQITPAMQNYSSNLFFLSNLTVDPAQLDNYVYLSWSAHVAHQKEDTFLYCRRSGETLPCSDYVETHITDVGFCWTFHSMKYISEHEPIMMTSTGRNNDVELLLNVQSEEYLMPSFNGVGFYVSVHDPEDYPRSELRFFT